MCIWTDESETTKQKYIVVVFENLVGGISAHYICTLMPPTNGDEDANLRAVRAGGQERSQVRSPRR